MNLRSFLRTWTSVLAITIIGPLFWSCSGDSVTAPTTGTISGVVNIDTGGVAAGALVYTVPPSASVLSDSLGRYTIGDVSVGTVTVYALKIGCDTAMVSVNVLSSKVTTTDILLHVSKQNNAPNQARLVAPDSIATHVYKDKILLKWSCSDPDNDALNYDVYMGTGSNPGDLKLVAKGLTTSEYSATLQQGYVEYQWRVVARDQLDKASTSPTWRFVSNSEWALHFDGLSQYAQVPSSTALNLSSQDYTIEMWVYIDSFDPEWQVIMTKDATNSNTDYLVQANHDGRILFQSRNLQNMVYSKNYFKAATWYHLAFQQSLDENKLRIFVNGSLVTEAALAGSAVTTSSPLLIGARINSASGGLPTALFAGKIDDLRIFNTVRSEAQINADMTTPLSGSEVGLIAGFNFNEGQGNTSQDVSANLNVLTLRNNPTWVVGHK